MRKVIPPFIANCFESTELFVFKQGLQVAIPSPQADVMLLGERRDSLVSNLGIILIFLLFLFPATFSFAQNAETLFNKAEAEFTNGKYEAAAALYTKVIAADPENVNAYLRRGFCYSVQQKYEQAIADFSHVIERHDNHPFAYISRGSAYNKIEDWQSALIDFDKALSLDPDNQEAYNNRGWAKVGLGLEKEACADWKKSKKLGNQEAKLILKNNHCK